MDRTERLARLRRVIWERWRTYTTLRDAANAAVERGDVEWRAYQVAAHRSWTAYDRLRDRYERRDEQYHRHTGETR